MRLDSSSNLNQAIDASPPTLFKQLEGLFVRIEQARDTVHNLRARLCGESPEMAGEKDIAPFGLINHFEMEIGKAMMALAKIEDDITQINRRL